MPRAARRKTSAEAETRDLSAIPAAALAAELRQRERRLQSLVRRYKRIMERGAKLREEIQALGGSVGRTGAVISPGTSRSRPRNETSLVDALRSVLSGKTLSVAEAAQQVVQAGYQSTSPFFRQIVNQTLHKSDQFKQVARGRYTAK